MGGWKGGGGGTNHTKVTKITEIVPFRSKFMVQYHWNLSLELPTKCHWLQVPI